MPILPARLVGKTWTSRNGRHLEPFHTLLMISQQCRGQFASRKVGPTVLTIADCLAQPFEPALTNLLRAFYPAWKRTVRHDLESWHFADGLGSAPARVAWPHYSHHYL